MQLLYLLDTNICIYIAKKKPLQVLEHFKTVSVGEAGMSLITYGELLSGAHKSQQREKVLENLETLSHLIPLLPMGTDVSMHYAHIRSMLEKKGTPIGNNDLWIAAHALSLNVTLVTNNEKEFRRVPGLKMENW